MVSGRIKIVPVTSLVSKIHLSDMLKCRVLLVHGLITESNEISVPYQDPSQVVHNYISPLIKLCKQTDRIPDVVRAFVPNLSAARQQSCGVGSSLIKLIKHVKEFRQEINDVPMLPNAMHTRVKSFFGIN